MKAGKVPSDDDYKRAMILSTLSANNSAEQPQKEVENKEELEVQTISKIPELISVDGHCSFSSRKGTHKKTS